MRAVAAIPAVGLLGGAATGLLLPDASPIALAALVLSAAAALWSWRLARVWALAWAVGAAFFAGGALLAADAWREAWRPTLRIVFEALAREQRQEAAREGRLLPENDTAFAIVTGVLRSDATRRAAGVSLSVKVRSVRTSVRGPALSGRALERGRGPARSGRALEWVRGPDLSGPVLEWGRGPALSGRALERVRGPDLSGRALEWGRGPDLSGRAVAAGDIPVSGGVLLTVAGALAAGHANEWRAGRTVRMPVQLRRPSRYLNPGVVDEERSLARRGTTLTGTVKSGALVEVVEPGSPVSETAWRLRSFARQAIQSSVGPWSARSAAIVTAIVVGDRAGLDDELERKLQEAGTYHVIAISGGNIAILAGLTLAGFRIAGVLGRAAMLTAIAGLLAYCYVVGGGASVNRATLMAVVYFAARAIDLRGPPLNALALVAAILVATDPLAVADAAFLLTCGATFAILLIAPALQMPRVPRAAAPAAAILAASTAAEAVLMPVGAYMFARVTFAGLGLNFAAIPLMAIAQLAGMAVLPASIAFPSLASGCGWVAHLGAEGLARSADVVDVAPFLTWRVAAPHWTVLVVYYVGLALAWSQRGALTPWRRRSGPLVVAAAAAWILFEPGHLLARDGDGRLHVTFIDVGQGDAALVRLPRGTTMLVDAGGSPGSSSFDIGDRVVGAVLRHAGVRRLDTAAFTHGDADHIGGAATILRDFRPRDVWEGIPVPPAGPLADLRAAAAAGGARWTSVQAGDVMAIDGVRIAVRHPGLADWERQSVRNDDSIVIELIWRDVSVVLTGDIGREVERAIAPLFPAAGIRIVKVPHHGSLTSSSAAFLRALGPRVAVVSAGRGNTFGHPAPAILDRYRQIGAEIFRTDQDGAVMVDTDGYSVDVRTFSGRRLHIN